MASASRSDVIKIELLNFNSVVYLLLLRTCIGGKIRLVCALALHTMGISVSKRNPTDTRSDFRRPIEQHGFHVMVINEAVKRS